MVKLENEMIRWGKLLFERRLISGWGGNLSCRLGEHDFLITGQHAPLGFLNTKHLVRIDRDGRPQDEGQKPSSETPMHLAIYAGTDAQVIIHTHPPMVLAFSLTHENFVPISFEEKYTIGEVPIIFQDTPTVTRPEKVVSELKYHPVIILKGHGTVAIGNDFEESFLLTDLLEEAVHCQFFKERLNRAPETAGAAPSKIQTTPIVPSGEAFELFSEEHMKALVEGANADSDFRSRGAETRLSTSLTLFLEDLGRAWTVQFRDGTITALQPEDTGEFLISGKAEWWTAVFSNRIDPFLATQQGKLKLKRGDLADLSRWYKPFQRAFALWQTIPIQ
jgi:L-fuculose-phosphate aldolase